MSVHRSKAPDKRGNRDKRPTRADLLGAYDAVIPDLVGPGLRALLVGINPSLYSGWSRTRATLRSAELGFLGVVV